MQNFVPIAHTPLAAGTRLKPLARDTSAAPLPELVHLEDPATQVMTDFSVVRAVTTPPERSIDDALEHMKLSGVRLLLVTDERRRVIGLITARDIQGERPVRLVGEQRIAHDDVTVEMIMTPQSAIEVIDYEKVLHAKVGDVLATLHALERQHGLVAQIDPASGEQALRGVFSTTQISRQLGVPVSDEVPTAHSFAEIVQEIGTP